MANSKGSSNYRNVMLGGKHSLLPPKSPFPSIPPAFSDYIPTGVIGPKAFPKPKDGNVYHQRTSSESFLLEEQPSWLDDLLNEPETPVRKGGHRRSSSDSFAYIDVTSGSNVDYAAPDEYRYKNLVSMPSWASQDFDYLKDARRAAFYAEANSVKPKSRAWELPVNALNHPINLPSARENAIMQNAGSTGAAQEADGRPSTASEKLETSEAGPNDPKSSSEKKDNHVKASASETDTKRAKQQFAQRSRVRKLQYIAELERNVQALQAEGSEVSAELEFLNQQNLILSMENKALKQRLESLAQEQLIKCLEQEVLEREIGRLRALYGQQQHQHQNQQLQKPPSSSHRRTNSRDLDSQFANLSLKHKDSNSGHDAVTGPLRI